MQLKYPLLTVIFIILFSLSQAQDILILNDKSEQKVKVIEVLSTELKYKKWEMMDGPIYTISKSDVFMVIYQNGQREAFKSTAVQPQNISSSGNSSIDQKIVNSSYSPSESNSNKKPVDLSITFVPRPKEFKKMSRLQKKEVIKNKEIAIGYVGDACTNIGVNLMTIGKSTVPTILLMTDLVVAKNIAFTIGMGFQYNSETQLGYKVRAVTTYFNIGSIYYFNQLLKLKKEKASLYAGISLFPAYTNSFIKDLSGNEIGSSTTSFSFNGALRLGGGYNFSKRIGLFSDVFIGKGKPAVVLGIRLNSLKLK